MRLAQQAGAPTRTEQRQRSGSAAREAARSALREASCLPARGPQVLADAQDGKLSHGEWVSLMALRQRAPQLRAALFSPRKGARAAISSLVSAGNGAIDDATGGCSDGAPAGAFCSAHAASSAVGIDSLVHSSSATGPMERLPAVSGGAVPAGAVVASGHASVGNATASASAPSTADDVSKRQAQLAAAALAAISAVGGAPLAPQAQRAAAAAARPILRRRLLGDDRDSKPGASALRATGSLSASAASTVISAGASGAAATTAGPEDMDEAAKQAQSRLPGSDWKERYGAAGAPVAAARRTHPGRWAFLMELWLMADG